MKTIDLFAGAGGITEGFRQAGASCVFANDFNQHACETFRHNHPGVKTVAGPIQDLDSTLIRRHAKLEKGELDILVGGPPCQGFSINAPERFLEDPRNSLFKHYLRFVDEFAKFADLGDPNFDDLPSDTFSSPFETTNVITRPSKMNDDEDIPF